MIKYLVPLFLLLWKCQAGDVRCKCICPLEMNSNISNIFVVNNLTSPDECICSHIVNREETYCLKCECKFETRNSVLIKFIIILVLAAIAALYLYMVVCIIQSHRKRSELSVTSDLLQEQLKEPAVRKRFNSTIGSLDRRMTLWQSQVDEQRNNVFGSKRF
jgi:TMEM9.